MNLKVLVLLTLLVGGTFAARGVSNATASPSGAPPIITLMMGGGSGDGGPATSARITNPNGIVIDSNGAMYVVDGCVVRKVVADYITTVAGNGGCTDTGDGGPALSASMYPYRLAVHGADLYILEEFTCRVRKLSNGIITTVAGNGSCGFSGDGGPAVAASLNNPRDLAVDSGGSIFIADYRNCRVREVVAGVISTVVGANSCASTGDGGLASAASITSPDALAIDPFDNVYLDDGMCRLRRIDATTRIITAAAGSQNGCFFAPDRVLNNQFVGLDADASGSVYIADGTCRIRKWDVVTHAVSVIAGNNLSCDSSFYETDPLRASLGLPADVAVARNGDVYFSEAMPNCRIKRISNWQLTTAAGAFGLCQAQNGDGYRVDQASNAGPVDVAVNSSGTIVIAEALSNSVREIKDGIVTTISSCILCHDPNTPLWTTLSSPGGVAIDDAGIVYVVDFGHCRVVKIENEIGSEFAGNGICGYSGDGGPADLAQLNLPFKVAVDHQGNVYIGDATNCRVRKVSAGTITTVAGSGVCASSGDGGLATDAAIQPWGLAVDSAGVLYISELCRVRMVATGVISTYAGNGTCGYTGDGGLPTDASVSRAMGLAVADNGDLYMTGATGCVVRVVHAGIISSVIGQAIGCTRVGYGDGDGGPASAGSLVYPAGLAVDHAGNLYISDGIADRVRLVTSNGQPAPLLYQAVSDGASLAVAGELRSIPNGAFQVEVFDEPTCDLGTTAQRTSLGTFSVGTDILGRASFVQILSSTVAPGHVLVATSSDPSRGMSVPLQCMTPRVTACSGDSDCDGYTDVAELPAGKDPFVYCPVMRADVNGDSMVNSIDLGRTAANFAKLPAGRFDQNMDGVVNSLDLGKIAVQFNKRTTWNCP